MQRQDTPKLVPAAAHRPVWQAQGSVPSTSICFALGTKEERLLMRSLHLLKILVPATARWPKGTLMASQNILEPSTLATLAVKAYSSSPRLPREGEERVEGRCLQRWELEKKPPTLPPPLWAACKAEPGHPPPSLPGHRADAHMLLKTTLKPRSSCS